MSLGLEDTQKGRVHMTHCPQHPALRMPRPRQSDHSIWVPSPERGSSDGAAAMGRNLGAGWGGAGESLDFWVHIQGF